MRLPSLYPSVGKPSAIARVLRQPSGIRPQRKGQQGVGLRAAGTTAAIGAEVVPRERPGCLADRAVEAEPAIVETVLRHRQEAVGPAAGRRRCARSGSVDRSSGAGSAEAIAVPARTPVMAPAIARPIETSGRVDEWTMLRLPVAGGPGSGAICTSRQRGPLTPARSGRLRRKARRVATEALLRLAAALDPNQGGPGAVARVFATKGISGEVVIPAFPGMTSRPSFGPSHDVHHHGNGDTE